MPEQVLPVNDWYLNIPANGWSETPSTTLGGQHDAAPQTLEMFGHLYHSLKRASEQIVQASEQIEGASRRMDAASQRVDLFFAWAGSGQPLAQQPATHGGE